MAPVWSSESRSSGSAGGQPAPGPERHLPSSVFSCYAYDSLRLSGLGNHTALTERRGRLLQRIVGDMNVGLGRYGRMYHQLHLGHLADAFIKSDLQ